MSIETELQDLELCRSYILSRMEEKPGPPVPPRQPGPAVTLSFETGTGVRGTTELLRQHLQAAEEPDAEGRWTVFDRQLIEKVLEEHNLPSVLSRHMPEERRSYLRDVTEELLGLRPPSWVIGPEIVQTVLHLAEAGRVILVGRGANLITSRLPHMFHARLIGSVEKRTQRIQSQQRLTSAEAARHVAHEDRAHGRYVKAHFHVRVEDPLHYHLVVNTDLVSPTDAAGMIADGARRCFAAPNQ